MGAGQHEAELTPAAALIDGEALTGLSGNWQRLAANLLGMALDADREDVVRFVPDRRK